MPHATLAWTVSNQYTIAVAGTNATIPELLAAIKEAIDANATKWMVSDYSAVNGTLEIKRNPAVGTVTGELASVRMLIFGGQTPHANAIASGHTALGTGTLYAAMSIDAATTGPSTSYASGAPYSTKYVKGNMICTNAVIALAQSPRVTIFEADDVFGFVISTNAVVCGYAGGRIIIRASDDTLLWGNMPSGGTYATSLQPQSMTEASAHLIPPYNDSSTIGMKSNYWDGSASRKWGRTIIPSNYATMALGESGQAMTLLPVPVCESADASGQSEVFLGYLRQIRLGPVAGHRVQMRDGSSTLIATHLFGGTGTGIGMWLDEVQ